MTDLTNLSGVLRIIAVHAANAFTAVLTKGKPATGLIGKPVTKVKGHAFIGVVVSEFYTLSLSVRIIVESTCPGSETMLFIFRPDQVEVIEL